MTSTPPSPGTRARTFIEQARRRQLIDAAIDTIAEVGYVGTSFAKIAKRAGVSPSLISYHFESKAELVAAVVTQIVGDLEVALVAATDGVGSPLAATRALIGGFFRYADTHRAHLLALQRITAALEPAQRAGVPALDDDQMVTGWRELLQAGQETGEFRPLDVRVVALAVHGMLIAGVQELFARPETDATHLADEVATMVVRAIRADHPA